MTKFNFYHPISRRKATELLLGLGSVAGAYAQAPKFPKQPIKWIVPYPAGGGSDALARIISSAMKDSLGQAVVIENRPGASTLIGTQALVTSIADGYTISTADVSTLAFNPSIFKKLPYDVNKSFSYIGGLARTSFALVTRQGLPVSSVQDLLSLAKKQPGKLSFASAGTGSPHHVAMELLRQVTGVELLHVPYKGGAPALQDLLAGQVDVMMLDLPGGLSHIRAGAVNVLGLTTPNRISIFPKFPTIAESGLPGFSAFSWQGVLAPAGTPLEASERLSQEIQKALKDPALRGKIEELGWEVMPMGSREFQAYAKSELLRWAPIIGAADIVMS